MITPLTGEVYRLSPVDNEGYIGHFPNPSTKRDKRDKTGHVLFVPRQNPSGKRGQTGHTPLGVSHCPVPWIARIHNSVQLVDAGQLHQLNPLTPINPLTPWDCRSLVDNRGPSPGWASAGTLSPDSSHDSKNLESGI